MDNFDKLFSGNSDGKSMKDEANAKLMMLRLFMDMAEAAMDDPIDKKAVHLLQTATDIVSKVNSLAEYIFTKKEADALTEEDVTSAIEYLELVGAGIDRYVEQRKSLPGGPTPE
jgi:hypothetical protein